MLEAFMSIFAIATSLTLLPNIFRIWQRKSSKDFSLWTLGMGLIIQIIWLTYSLHEGIPCMIIGGFAWLLMETLQVAFVLNFRKVT